MNIEEIDKWLDNKYGVSYTRLEELHDFVVEQDLKHREKKDKEIERLNNIINDFEKWLVEDLKVVYRDAGYRHKLIIEVLERLQELKGSDKE